MEPENAHFTGEFVIVAKFGDYMLHRLASRLLIVIKQADENSNLGDFFIIQYLAFGSYLFILNAVFDFGSAKTIP